MINRRKSVSHYKKSDISDKIFRNYRCNQEKILGYNIFPPSISSMTKRIHTPDDNGNLPNEPGQHIFFAHKTNLGMEEVEILKQRSKMY